MFCEQEVCGLTRVVVKSLLSGSWSVLSTSLQKFHSHAFLRIFCLLMVCLNKPAMTEYMVSSGTVINE